MGEAFLNFQQISENEPSRKDCDQVHLPLTKPCNKGKFLKPNIYKWKSFKFRWLDSEYLQVLESRSWDKSAKEFAKRERKRMNCK